MIRLITISLTSQGRADGMRRKKAQTGLEVMAYFFMILVIFSASYIFLTSRTLSAMNSGANEEARGIAAKVASEISAAVAEGDGYSKSFKLPDSVKGASYNVSVEKGIVFVDWSKTAATSHTVADNVTGNFTPGWNTVKNKGGIILVNNTME